jgi:hypothetical protein
MLNLPDIVGWTPLHIACYYKRPDVMLLLLKNGANLFTKDREGITPLDLVFDNGECLQVINNFLALNKDNTERTQPQSEITMCSFDPKNNLKKLICHKQYKKRANFSSGNLAETIENEESQKVLNNYKFIPKRHKFYYNYMKNDCDFNFDNKDITKTLNRMKTSQETECLNSPREEDLFTKKNTLKRVKNELNKENIRCPIREDKCLIKGPLIFPQVKQFTNVKYCNTYTVNTECTSNRINDNSIQRLHNLYLVSGNSDDESFNFENILKNKSQNRKKLSHRNRNRSLIIDGDEDKSKSNDDISLNDDNSFSISENQPYYNINDAILHNVNDFRLFEKPDTKNFLINIKLDEIFFKLYGCKKEMVDELICFLFNFDYKFTFLLFLNIMEIRNSKEKLLSYLRGININKNLLGLLLSRDKDDMCKTLYFNSFELGKSSLRDSLRKSFKSKIF